MRILITNNSLASRAGSELFVRDLAIELMRRGHQPVVFCTSLGFLADELRDATIPVTDRLETLGAPPDIIHGHHHLEAVMATLFFPEVPAIHYCHGWMPWQEIPLQAPQIRRYVAVSHLCRERLVSEGGIAPEKVEVIGNFFDERLFPLRSPLPQRPRRVLAFGNDFSELCGIPPIREACQSLRLEFAAAGMNAGGFETNPAHRLAQYDIVFAKGRAAIEALAVGTAVILCNGDRLGPLITPENFRTVRDLNFGMRAMSRPLLTEHVMEEIQHYHAGQAAAVTRLARAECGMQPAVDRIVALYSTVIEEARSTPAPSATATARAAGRYFEHWAPLYKRAVDGAPEIERWRRRSDATETSLAALREDRRELLERCAAAETSTTQPDTRLWMERCHLAERSFQQVQHDYTRLLEAVHGGNQLRAEIAAIETRWQRSESALQSIRASATWRWSQKILQAPLTQWMFGRWIQHVATHSSPSATAAPPAAAPSLQRQTQ